MDPEEVGWWRAKARLDAVEYGARDNAREGVAPPPTYAPRLTQHVQRIWMDAKTRNAQ